MPRRRDLPRERTQDRQSIPPLSWELASSCGWKLPQARERTTRGSEVMVPTVHTGPNISACSYYFVPDRTSRFMGQWVECSKSGTCLNSGKSLLLDYVLLLPPTPNNLQKRDPKGSNCFQVNSLQPRTKLENIHRNTKLSSTRQGKLIMSVVRLKISRTSM